MWLWRVTEEGEEKGKKDLSDTLLCANVDRKSISWVGKCQEEETKGRDV